MSDNDHDYILERYRERVGIKMDSHIPEAEAIRQAYWELRKEFGREAMPEEAVEEFRKVVNDGR
jgi:hypothetical protein